MYNVQIMKRYRATAARQHFSDLLDAAERGEEVVIERRGVRFRVEPLPVSKRPKRRKPFFKVLDPAVEAGQWSWEWEPGKDLRFVDTRKRK
jgi:prevent-host-death family protein